MEIIELDIKSESQTVSVAIAQFLVELDILKFSNQPLLKVLHGYGSGGKGGEIKRELNRTLEILKRKKTILDYINLEKWNDNNKDIISYKHKYPILMIDKDVIIKNSGQTIVIIH